LTLDGVGAVMVDRHHGAIRRAVDRVLRLAWLGGRCKSDTEVVFKNLQHDFPQRIVVAIKDGGKLKARIEGLRNGSLRVIPFPMTRVSCDGKEPLY
jgi:hypothetical protein